MKNWKEIVKSVAPMIGTTLGGPLAGSATKFIAEKFLGDAAAPVSKVIKAIEEATPEKLAQLSEVDKQFELEMEKLGIDVYKLEVEDRKSARDLFKVNIWPQIILSGLFVIGYFTVLFVLMRSGKRLDFKDAQWLQGVFTTILGVLTAAIPQILSFWFGSSLGSKEKNRGLMENK